MVPVTESVHAGEVQRVGVVDLDRLPLLDGEAAGNGSGFGPADQLAGAAPLAYVIGKQGDLRGPASAGAPDATARATALESGEGQREPVHLAFLHRSCRPTTRAATMPAHEYSKSRQWKTARGPVRVRIRVRGRMRIVRCVDRLCRPGRYPQTGRAKVKITEIRTFISWAGLRNRVLVKVMTDGGPMAGAKRRWRASRRRSRPVSRGSARRWIGKTAATRTPLAAALPASFLARRAGGQLGHRGTRPCPVGHRRQGLWRAGFTRCWGRGARPAAALYACGHL